MKRIQSLVNSLIVCGVAMAMVSALAAQTTEDVATVVRIKGSARYSVGNSGWRTLQVGDVLRAGSVVQTATDPGSYVDLVLSGENVPAPRPAVYNTSVTRTIAPGVGGTAMPKSEQNVIRLSENTALGIDKLSSTHTGADVVTDTQLDLRAGHIFGTVKKMSPASKYEIKLPNGVAGIRGTVYDLSADGLLRVLVGSVVLAYVGPDGKVVTQVVAANHQFDSRTGALSILNASAVDELSAVATAARFTTTATLSSMWAIDHTIEFVSQTGPTTVPAGSGD